MLNHKHLLIKGLLRNPPKDEQVLIDWLNELVKAIDMKVMMGPYAKYLDVKGNRGITGAVVIETSHCSIHIWDEQSPALVQMDVYSCKDFDEKIVLDQLDKAFGLISSDRILVDRNKKLKISLIRLLKEFLRLK